MSMRDWRVTIVPCFSALQRAEIAEIRAPPVITPGQPCGFSALQRAEIAEIIRHIVDQHVHQRFSALQRAEIAEIQIQDCGLRKRNVRFSALQRAEIAEIVALAAPQLPPALFQCSSTSRNC